MASYLEETQVELLDAIMFDDYETVSNLLRSGVNPNFSTSDFINGETTPLHSAVSQKQYKHCEYLTRPQCQRRLY